MEQFASPLVNSEKYNSNRLCVLPLVIISTLEQLVACGHIILQQERNNYEGKYVIFRGFLTLGEIRREKRRDELPVLN